MTTHTYVALSTLNPSYGWDIYGIGSNKDTLESKAEGLIGAFFGQGSIEDIERGTLAVNLKIVSKTKAKSLYKIDINNYAFDEDLGKYVDIRGE